MRVPKPNQWTLLFVLMAIAIYLLSFNPYLGPEVYDDVVYQTAAESIADGKGYQFQGKIIGDWPPLFSFLLAFPMMFGLTSVWISKAIVLCFVGLSYYILLELFRLERRENTAACLLLMVFAPISLICGSRVLSEWVFMFFSYLFLVSLYKVDQSIHWVLWAIVGSLCLALALLTRYAGVTLFVPLFASFFSRESYKWRRVIAKAYMGFMGCGLFMGLWFFPLRQSLQAGSATVRYYAGIENLILLDWRSFFNEATTLFFNANAFNEQGLTLSVVLVFLLLILCIYGFYQHVRTKGLLYADYWVLTSLVICLLLTAKYPRYLLPIAPFLFSYAILALQNFFKNKLGAVVVACWLGLFVMMDVHLVVRGNGRTYNALNPWLSPTGRDFYRGYWSDLYDVSQIVQKQPCQGSVGFLGEELVGEKYFWFFTRREVLTSDPLAQQPPYVLSLASTGEKATNPPGYQQLYQNPSFVIWKNEKGCYPNSQ